MTTRRNQPARSKPDDAPDVESMSAEEIQKVVHELQSHQVELEMQNDQLRRTQWDLEESRARYAELYDYAPVGYFTFDENVRVVEANLTGMAMLGLERNQIIGYPFVSFVSGSHLADTFILHCRKARETQTKQTCELKLRHPRIDEFDVRLETIAFVGQDDSYLWYRTAVSDITEPKLTEAALHKTEERLRLAVHRAPLLLYHQDKALKYTWMHDPYPGLSMKEILGKTDRDIFPAEQAVRLNLIKQTVLETGVGIRENVQLAVRDRDFYYDLTVEPLKDWVGNIIGLTCAAVDVTERRRDEQIIKRHNDEMEDFLYILVHDLKGPVVSLQGLLGMLHEERDTLLNGDGGKILDHCIEECSRMKDIVLQVREMGRIKQTAVVQEKEHLRDFINIALQRFDKQIKETGVRTVLECPDVYAVFAKAQVDQALNNLLDNALKYGSSAAAPELKIVCQMERAATRISVRDNGPGIAPVHHQQVFKLFRRLDPQGPVKGPGVGLTAVQSLMRRIGGDVTLESDTGQGANFTISFPAQISTNS